MNKFRFTINALAIAIFTFAFASMAQAQATRTWVSGVGDDVNPCSRTAPCKTFAGAISKTAACGEIDALDPGGFGAVTITKSMTIDGTGTMASILAAGTTGVIVNAVSTTAGVAKASLDNIRLSGNGNGLHAKNNSKVTARNCVFSNNNSIGVFVDGVSAAALVHIWASQISLNANNGIVAGNAGNTGASGITIAQNMIDRNTGFGVTTGAGGAV